jgi:phage baseplate assembly protein W
MSSTSKKNTNIDFDIFENDQVYDSISDSSRLVNEDLYEPSTDALIARSPALSVKLPIEKISSNISSDGYDMVRGYQNLVKQNFKNLMLTAPGEKMMDPEFGVGLRKFLFENSTQVTPSQLKGRIKSQSIKYLPYINILSIEFGEEDQNNLNVLRASISYFIKPLNLQAIFDYPTLEKDNFSISRGAF